MQRAANCCSLIANANCADRPGVVACSEIAHLVWAPGIIVLNAISHVGFRIAIVPSNNQLNSDFSLRSQQHLLGPWRKIQNVKGLHETGTLSLS